MGQQEALDVQRANDTGSPQGMKRSLKRFGEWIGRFALQVHLGPRFGSFGASVIGADPIEKWEQAQREAEELDRKQALEPDDPER